MPRIDPITGCTVQTLGECFADMAEREGEGRTGADVMNEMLADFDREMRAEERALRKPAVALARLRAAVEDWNAYVEEPSERIPLPVRVKRVFCAKIGASPFRGGSSERLTALCLMPDGRRGVLTFWSWSTPGSFYEPPDGESNVHWSRVRR